MQIIPSALVRRLAMQKLRLTDEEEEEEENENITYAAADKKGRQTRQVQGIWSAECDTRYLSVCTPILCMHTRYQRGS
jgi:hypothetical protein